MADLPIYFDPDEDVSAEERQRRNSCLAKATFGSAVEAQAARIQAQHQQSPVSSLDIYQCRHCGRWHLSRQN